MPDKPSGNAREAELAKQAAAFTDAFTNSEPAFTRDRRVVFVSNRDGIPQLYLAKRPDEPATRIVATGQRVTSPIVTAEDRSVIFRSDTGADENWSIFRVNLDGSGLVELTPGKRLERDAPIIPDGRPSTMYFSARERTSPASTIYSSSTTTAGEPKALYRDDKPAFLIDVSSDGKTALVIRYPSRSENYLVEVDLERGTSRPLFPASGQVTIFDARLARDNRRVYVATDNGKDEALLLALDRKTGKQLAKRAFDPPTAQITELAVSRDSRLVGVALAVGHHSQVKLVDARSLADRSAGKLPLGSGTIGKFSLDGNQLAATWSTPRSPTDIVAIDVRTGNVSPLRQETRPSLPHMPAIDTYVAEIPAFDGGKIPTLVHLPAAPSRDPTKQAPITDHAKRHPVIVSYHGGPSAVSTVGWSAARAFLVGLGYAVVEPNVRGSGGYGRAYEAADNGPRRLDAFRDVETSARWGAAQPWADKDRMVVYGGSYGGYTVLVALSRWPEIWRAGVNLFGVASLDTFMKTTSGLIREIFLVEFGDPEKDKDFLTSISPLNDVAKIVDPTFVYAGANDPRVPRSESDLIVRALRSRNVPAEYMVANDEGHSIARRPNQIELFSRVARFLETHLR